MSVFIYMCTHADVHVANTIYCAVSHSSHVAMLCMWITYSHVDLCCMYAYIFEIACMHMYLCMLPQCM